MTRIPVVDFFAGPGGLGEGFSAFSPGGAGNPFRIALSVEKDPSAHSTLRLRAFVRRFPEGELPDSYYRYVRGETESPHDLSTLAEWEEAGEEALCAALGDPAGDAEVDKRLRRLALKGKPWVLIGGPPCQAYSLVGRSRNAGNADYRPEADVRHFLYRQYLRVLDELAPPVFVLENVRGVLSSTVSGRGVFQQMLTDLTRPAVALRTSRSRGAQYRIRALASPTVMNPGDDPGELDSRDFLVRAELHGVPQARHRVILVGVRTDLDAHRFETAAFREPPNLQQVIGGLPRLRSAISKGDEWVTWRKHILTYATSVRKELADIFGEAGRQDIEAAVGVTEQALPEQRTSTAPASNRELGRAAPDLARWYRDPALRFTLNHEARSHMAEDLHRYLFCAAYGRLTGHSPSARDFPGSLAPAHNSWGVGGFDDRFRVQLATGPATTITSHIAKDGHYFIHYDPSQCRSLTVREAARIQTFPDNYFFEGNRTQQYVQVGNAVPPLVALEVARLVHDILTAA